jgi:PAS domain S-box-containing protein
MAWKNTVRILVVDDDPDLLSGTARVIENAGFAVEKASTGGEALTRLTGRPDLLLLDRDLPDMDGVEIVQRLRQHPSPRDPLVVLISAAYADSAHRTQGLELGADGYIQRPINNRELAAQVASYARMAYLTRSSRELAERLAEQNEILIQQRSEALRLTREALEAKESADKANKALVESEAQFRTLVEGANDAICVQSGDRLTYLNSAAGRLFGVERPESLEGCDFLEFFAPSARESLAARLRDLNERKGPIPPFEAIVTGPGGRQTPVEVSAARIRFRGEESVLIFAHDITVRRAKDRQQALAVEVLGAMNRSSDDGRLTADILQMIQAWTGVSAASICLRVDQTCMHSGLASLPGSSTAPAGGCTGGLSYCLECEIVPGEIENEEMKSICRQVFRGTTDLSQPYFTKGGSFWTNRASELPFTGFHSAAPNRRYESMALIPLRSGIQAVGLLHLGDHRAGLFSRESIEFLENLSDSIGIALERKVASDALKQSRQQLRALSARLQNLREDERTHISRRLHDELGQMMTGIKMNLSAMESCLEDLSEDRKLNPLVDLTVRAAELADAAFQSLQGISTELRPGTLEKLGLAGAIQYEAGRVAKLTGLRCNVLIPAEPLHLGPEAATALFRIFEEALSNVVEHSGATEVEVALREEGGTCMLEVRDNGKGMVPDDLSRPTSVGILGMQERARRLSGSVLFASRPEGGTVVKVQIPSGTEQDGNS